MTTDEMGGPPQPKSDIILVIIVIGLLLLLGGILDLGWFWIKAKIFSGMMK